MKLCHPVPSVFVPGYKFRYTTWQTKRWNQKTNRKRNQSRNQVEISLENATVNYPSYETSFLENKTIRTIKNFKVIRLATDEYNDSTAKRSDTVKWTSWRWSYDSYQDRMIDRWLRVCWNCVSIEPFDGFTWQACTSHSDHWDRLCSCNWSDLKLCSINVYSKTWITFRQKTYRTT